MKLSNTYNFYLNKTFIFKALSPVDYKYVMKVVETAILSTDLAMYFKKRSKFLELTEDGEFDWQNEDKKECMYLYEHSNIIIDINYFLFISIQYFAV